MGVRSSAAFSSSSFLLSRPALFFSSFAFGGLFSFACSVKPNGTRRRDGFAAVWKTFDSGSKRRVEIFYFLKKGNGDFFPRPDYAILLFFREKRKDKTKE